MSNFGILDPIFEIAQKGFSLRDLRWNLFYLTKMKMVLAKKGKFDIPIIWLQKNITHSLFLRKISDRAAVGQFEMLLSDFKFFWFNAIFKHKNCSYVF